MGPPLALSLVPPNEPPVVIAQDCGLTRELEDGIEGGRVASRLGFEEIRFKSSIRGPLALRSVVCIGPHLSVAETKAPVIELACSYFPGLGTGLRGRCMRPNQIL